MALGVASVLVSGWWLLGGTAGLDSLGGGLERLARGRWATALVVLTVVVVVAKLAAVVLAWTLTRPNAPRPLARVAQWGGAALAAYGLLLTAGGAVGLVLDAEGADRYALAWHTALWDPWFAAWGIALALAGRGRLAQP